MGEAGIAAVRAVSTELHPEALPGRHVNQQDAVPPRVKAACRGLHRCEPVDLDNLMPGRTVQRKLGALILQTLKENAGNVVFRAESIRGQGTWFTLMLDAAPGAMPN